MNKEYPESTKFMNNHWEEYQLGKDYKSEIYKTRVIAFIYNQDDFDEEIKSLRVAAKKSLRRINLRIALVTDTRLIKQYK